MDERYIPFEDLTLQNQHGTAEGHCMDMQGFDAGGCYSPGITGYCSTSSSPISSPDLGYFSDESPFALDSIGQEQRESPYICGTASEYTVTELRPVCVKQPWFDEMSAQIYQTDYVQQNDVWNTKSSTSSPLETLHVVETIGKVVYALLGQHKYPIDLDAKFNDIEDPAGCPKGIPHTVTDMCPPSRRPQPSTGVRGHGKRVPRAERLWEFILRLLLDRTYNPSLIEWVDRGAGMFRLVDSKGIARMWGQRKNNHDMTYEKLSRAMRYYYHREILLPVYGKKLVYKFGPRSTGWQ